MGGLRDDETAKIWMTTVVALAAALSIMQPGSALATGGEGVPGGVPTVGRV